MKAPNEIPVAPKVDQDLFESFTEITSGLKEFYSYLTVAPGQKSVVVDAWQKGESPSLYPALEPEQIEDLERSAEELAAMKASIPDDDDPVHILYRWKVDETIAQVDMVLASVRGDDKTFKRLNHELYGSPDEALYRAGLDWVCNDAEEILADEKSSAALRGAASDVVAMLGPERGYRELLSPESYVFEEIRQDHFRNTGYFALLLDGIEQPEGMITPEQGDAIIEHVLRNNLATDYSFEKRKGATWGVSHSAKKVHGPETYSYDWQRFIGLPLGHEIGTHLAETSNALEGPLLLASVGLDHFERGTEGRAVIREQVPYDSFDEFGKLVRWRDILRRHIAISHAEGVGQDEPPRHSEVFEFMKKLDYMYALTEKDNVDEATELAEKRASTLLLRVLKGTNGEGAYLKDKVYLEGNVAAWLVAALRGASAISEADKAKYDINNARHLSALLRLGVINHGA